MLDINIILGIRPYRSSRFLKCNILVSTTMMLFFITTIIGIIILTNEMVDAVEEDVSTILTTAIENNEDYVENDEIFDIDDLINDELLLLDQQNNNILSIPDQLDQQQQEQNSSNTTTSSSPDLQQQDPEDNTNATTDSDNINNNNTQQTLGIMNNSSVLPTSGSENDNSTSSTTTATDTSTTDTKEEVVVVKVNEQQQQQQITVQSQTYLESLSDDELIAICSDRGYEITMESNDTSTITDNNNSTLSLTHDDYVKAAIQCISLDKETDTIIANNPDIAANIDIEVERLRIEKEKLELERDTILNEIHTLHDQLQQNGIDPSSINATLPSAVRSTTSIAYNASNIEEVLRESFVILFDRVGKDIQLVCNILVQFVFQPLLSSIQFVYKYIHPTIIQSIVRPIILYIQYNPTIVHFIQMIQNQFLIPIQQLLQHQHESLFQIISVNNILIFLKQHQQQVQQFRPIITKSIDILHETIPESIQFPIRIIWKSFCIPLYESLSTGWNQLIVPNLIIVRSNFISIYQQLRDDINNNVDTTTKDEK